MSYYFEDDGHGNVDWAAFFEERELDYEAIGRANALLVLAKRMNPVICRKWKIMKAGEDNFFPLYAVREAGLFRSKEIPGFARGRMVDIVRQLKEVCNLPTDTSADAEIDEIVKLIELSPVSGKA